MGSGADRSAIWIVTVGTGLSPRNGGGRGPPLLLLFVRIGEVDNLVWTVTWQIVNSLGYRLNRTVKMLTLAQNQFIIVQDLQV